MGQALAKSRSPHRIGAVLHGALLYDVQIWLATLGRERSLREAMLRPAHVAQGECVLDVGCGTGTLAIAAKHAAGKEGSIVGVDASAAMIARARSKSRAAGVEIRFLQASAQSLPFPEASFDVVVSTLMLHHLGRAARAQLAQEICRVLKPGGRLLAVEFLPKNSNDGRWFSRIHRHGHLKERDMAAVLHDAGMTIEVSGPVEWSGTRAIGKMHFALARVSRVYHLPVGT